MPGHRTRRGVRTSRNPRARKKSRMAFSVCPRMRRALSRLGSKIFSIQNSDFPGVRLGVRSWNSPLARTCTQSPSRKLGEDSGGTAKVRVSEKPRIMAEEEVREMQRPRKAGFDFMVHPLLAQNRQEPVAKKCRSMQRAFLIYAAFRCQMRHSVKRPSVQLIEIASFYEWHFACFSTYS